MTNSTELSPFIQNPISSYFEHEYSIYLIIWISI
jgi:hypothetical protein